jgi:hypothetical protein
LPPGRGHLALNPLVYAKVSVERIEELDHALPAEALLQLPLSVGRRRSSQGECFLAYRRAGGLRRSPLPDFRIGAQAAVAGMPVPAGDPPATAPTCRSPS